MTAQSSLAETGTGMPPKEIRQGASTGSTAVALLRVTLGVILVVTWFDNLSKDLYTADGLEGFLGWLSTPVADGGNGGTLDAYHSLLDSVIQPIAGPYATFQLVAEAVLGVGLLLGAFTRLLSLGAAVFFLSLFLGYFGGQEWIWTYVLLTMAAVTVFLGYGGRKFGIDQSIASNRGDSPLGNLLW